MEISKNITYCSIGRPQGIGASAHYLQFERFGVLLDAGIDPTVNGVDALPDYHVLDNCPLNAIIITHAHLDHIGSLPVAIQHFPHARVYMTPATAELTEQMLYHYLRVQRKKEGKDAITIFSEPYLEEIHYLYQTFEYNKAFPLHSLEESGLQFSFYDAGHILGSAGVLIEWQGKRIFYTGNTRKSAQFILKGARYPEPPIDLLISESTYGADGEAEKVRRKAEVKRFAEVLTERLRVGGIVLLPVFALGRTQEMIMLIDHLRRRNKIPVAPIYITGLGLRINKTYDRLLHKIYPNFDAGTIRAMTFDRWHHTRRLKGPAILLSTSGMMYPGSPSFEYARELVENPRNGIFFVGYADPETPGGLFRQKKYETLKSLFGVESIACKVDIFRFSAHSHRRELLAMIKQMQPRRVVLVHGDAPALEWMADHTRQLLPHSDVIIPQAGVWYEFR